MKLYAHDAKMTPIEFKADQPSVKFEVTAKEFKERGQDFPLVEDFELIVAGSGKSTMDMPFGAELGGLFVDNKDGKAFAYYVLYGLYTEGPYKPLPLIQNEAELIGRLEEDYAFALAADGQYVYVAEADNTPAGYNHYAKIPRAKYEAEWQALLEATAVARKQLQDSHQKR